PDCRRFLSGLEFTSTVDGAFLVHATPSEPEKWNYIFDPSDAVRELDSLAEDVCFVGHSHFALFFAAEGDRCKLSLPVPLKLEDHKRYIVNVGSVGQPRDHLSSACFAVFDASVGTVEFHRVEYDCKRAYKKILKAGLPRFLAERLLVGE
ncbi:MAG: metallophosphoesterase, partial [Candidatus Eisenbacteria bacterium]